MINSALRIELSQDIRRLATGNMTNDAFDERYYEVYEESEDRAICAIAGYCYGLYSSDLLWPIRLRGNNALGRETKKTIARCVLFLRSSNEYGWPPFPDSPERRCVTGIARSFGLAGGIAVTIVGLAWAISDLEPLAFVLLAIGLLLSAASYHAGFLRPMVLPNDWDRFTSFGDYDCWPFLCRESFETSRKHNHLLAR